GPTGLAIVGHGHRRPRPARSCCADTTAARDHSTFAAPGACLAADGGALVAIAAAGSSRDALAREPVRLCARARILAILVRAKTPDRNHRVERFASARARSGACQR